jgi:hypothetical protein
LPTFDRRVSKLNGIPFVGNQFGETILAHPR